MKTKSVNSICKFKKKKTNSNSVFIFLFFFSKENNAAGDSIIFLRWIRVRYIYGNETNRRVEIYTFFFFFKICISINCFFWKKKLQVWRTAAIRAVTYRCTAPCPNLRSKAKGSNAIDGLTTTNRTRRDEYCRRSNDPGWRPVRSLDQGQINREEGWTWGLGRGAYSRESNFGTDK